MIFGNEMSGFGRVPKSNRQMATDGKRRLADADATHRE
jgi:hypothetical protein